MSIDQYSTTPASNGMANYVRTGMRPSAAKNAGWKGNYGEGDRPGPGTVTRPSPAAAGAASGAEG